MTPRAPPVALARDASTETPAAREDAMTRPRRTEPHVSPSSSDRAEPGQPSGRLRSHGVDASGAAERAPAKAQACNEALPDITHHDVDRFGRVQAYAQGRRRGRDPPELPRLRRGQGAVDDMGAWSTATDARAPRPRQAGSKSRTSRALTDSGAPGPHRGPQARRGSGEPPGHRRLWPSFFASRSRQPSPPVHRRAPPPDKHPTPIPRTRISLRRLTRRGASGRCETRQPI